MRERAACAGRRLYSQALEYLVRAATARLQPDFIEAQDVAIRMAVGALGEFVQSIDERLEFAGELGKDCTQDPPWAARVRGGKRAVGTPAHGNVVVNVDELPREALCKESGDEQ